MKKTMLMIGLFVCCLIVNAECRRDTIYNYEFDIQQNKIPKNRYINTYNVNDLIKTIVFQNYASGVWTNKTKYEYLYNSSDQETTRNVYNWNVNFWQNSSKWNKTYTNNLLVEQLSENYINNVWTNDNKLTYVYNANQKIATSTLVYWVAGAWKNNRLVNHTYNISNLETEEIVKTWTNNAWLNTERSTFTYDASNLKLQEQTYKWNAGAWVEDIKSDFYNSSLGIDSILEFQKVGNSWVKYGKSNLYYNTASELEKEEYKKWVNNNWVYDYKVTYEYNTNNDLTAVDDSYDWDAIANSFATHIRTEYKCNAFATGINSLEKRELSIYPNPIVGNHFILSSETNESYQLYDFTGKIIQQGTINVGENTIETPDLPTGIYVVRIGSYTQKITKQ